MQKLTNFAWVFSFLIFFAAFLLSYAYLPELVGIHATDAGVADEFISKETFFYSGLLIFVVCNLVAFFFSRVMNSIPYESGIYFRSEIYKDNILGWFAGFMAIVNIFLALGAAYITLFNNQDTSHISRFNSLVLIAPLLAVISLVWLAYIVRNRHQQPVLD